MAGADKVRGAGDVAGFEVEATGVADRLSLLVTAPERGNGRTAVVAGRRRGCRRRRRSGWSRRKSYDRGMRGNRGVDVR